MLIYITDIHLSKSTASLIPTVIHHCNTPATSYLAVTHKKLTFLLIETFCIPSNSKMKHKNHSNYQLSGFSNEAARVGVCLCVCVGWPLFLQQCNTERWGEKVEQSISVLCFNQQIRW